MSDKMIPFGKHKGKPIEAILDDHKYREWLLAQSWFKEQHTNLYTIVINNGQEPVDTPEHNAMQIRFLSEEFRLKFALAAKGERIFAFTRNKVIKEIAENVAKIREEVITRREIQIEIGHRERAEYYQQEVERCRRCQGNRQDDCYHYLPSKDIHGVPEISVIGSYEDDRARLCNRLITCPAPAFEDNGSDVRFTLQVGFKFSPSQIGLHTQDAAGQYEHLNLPDHLRRHQFTIEIKPTVGDDYPSVLRQMKRNHSEYLLLRGYTGVGANEQQFKDFFKSQDIMVIFERDVDALTLPEFDREISNQAAD